MFMQVAIADRVAFVIIKFLKRAWPWLRFCLQDMPEHGTQMAESGRHALFALPAWYF